MVAPSDRIRNEGTSTLMHPFCLDTNVVTPSVPPPARPAKKGKKPRVNNFLHSDGFTETLANLQNRVTDAQLAVLLELGVRKSHVSERYLRVLHGWKLPIDQCTVRFSARFNALWVVHRDAVVWMCVVDGEFIVFALKRFDRLSIAHADGKSRYPELRIPAHGVRWSALQQLLVENFEDDETVRAISAAAMISCTPSGKYNGVARELLSSKLQLTVRSKVIYDSPVDEDIVSVLADAYEYDGRLLFKCGGGYVVESSMKDSMAVLKRRKCPLKLLPFEERHDLLMPFLFH